VKSLLKILPVLSLALATSQSALAAASPFCLPFAALKMRADSCDDNFAIGKKADACLSLYTNELNSGRAQMDKALKDEAAKGPSQQSGALATTNTVLDRTVSELDRLIANGEAAKLAVHSYSDSLSLPEDYDQPGLTNMSTAKYLSVEPCYATPNRVISEDSAVLELMVDDLKKAKSEVLAKGGSALMKSSQMGSAMVSEPLKGKAPAVPVMPKGSFKERDSDVTGIEESKKRNEQKK
jgi:hypothetical protein